MQQTILSKIALTIIEKQKEQEFPFCIKVKVNNKGSKEYILYYDAAYDNYDFIMRLADLLLSKELMIVERACVVKLICTFLANIKEKTIIEMYLSSLKKYKISKHIWQETICMQLRMNAEAEIKEKGEKEVEMFKRYGFYIENNKYYSINDKGVYEWSNFIMEPLLHIKDEVMAKRTFIIRNEYGVEKFIEMKQRDLVTLSNFKKKVNEYGNFIWKASGKELIKLKSYLYENAKTISEDSIDKY